MELFSESIKTKEALKKATRSHISDVVSGMNFIADQIRSRAPSHDHTKLEHLEDYFNALNDPDFRNSKWRQYHARSERHHLKRFTPGDVNLIDVIEHLVDCTTAGMVRSRTGRIFDTDISPEVLTRAVRNTVNLIKNNVRVNYSESYIADIDIGSEPISDEDAYYE